MQPGELGGDRDDVDRHVRPWRLGRVRTRGSAHSALLSKRSRRGSAPAVAPRSAPTAARPSSDSCAGTWTPIVTSRSPRGPSRGGGPRPRTPKVRPFGVPGGTRTVTGAPDSVGTLTSAPRTASSNVTGTVTVTLLPDRPKTGWAATFTTTYKSPGEPPFSPFAPLPVSLIRWVSLTPAGILAWMVRSDSPRPEPLQAGHGSSTTIPRPRQE